MSITQGDVKSLDFIDRGKEIKIPLNYNDHSGLLNQRAKATFSIMDAGSSLPYVNGRVIFLLAVLLVKNTRFMDSITSSPGLTVNQYYTCDYAYNKVFQNKLEISRTTDKAAPPLVDEHKIHCGGQVLSSELSELLNRVKKYTVTCTNHTSDAFEGTLYNASRCDDPFCDNWKYKWEKPFILTDLNVTKTELDQKIGAPFCKGWEEGYSRKGHTLHPRICFF